MKTTLRSYAKGRECQIRAPGCNHNNDTVVLCHLNGGGMGMKHHDLLGAWGCSKCHDYVDNRTGIASQTMRKLYHLEGMVRTLQCLIDEGVIQIE